MLACTKDNLEIIKFLVNNKADLDQVNKDGWNALHIAVRLSLIHSNLFIILYLYQYCLQGRK